MKRPPLSAFDAAASAELTPTHKKYLAIMLYLTLEALDDLSPEDEDGEPADVVVQVGGAEFCLQNMIVDVLANTFNVPLGGETESVGDA